MNHFRHLPATLRVILDAVGLAACAAYLAAFVYVLDVLLGG